MFIRVIPVNLNKLFQDSCSTTSTFHGKPSGVMKMTVNLPGVFVVTILRTKDGRANRASKMFDVKLHVKGRNITTS